MTSKVSITNQALAHLGQTILITSLDEASIAAEQAKLFFDQCVKEILERADWPFARTSQLLANLGDPPTNWDYRYQYPADCVRLRGLVTSGLRVKRRNQIEPYQLQYYDGSVTIVTDVEDAEISYTAAVTDVTIFSPLFVTTLSWKLATALASPLRVDAKILQLCQQQYEYHLGLAYTSQLNQEAEDIPPDSEFISGRR